MARSVLYCSVLYCTVLYCTVQGLCDATLVPGRSWGDPRAKDGSHQATKRDCARLCASYSACRAWTFNTQVTLLTTAVEIFNTKISFIWSM